MIKELDIKNKGKLLITKKNKTTDTRISHNKNSGVYLFSELYIIYPAIKRSMERMSHFSYLQHSGVVKANE